ncbi:hypothetical protein QBC46DRAFT_390937 [Diplogelasinospora grovesii]|uniref:Uncharacterized protein n=1 Tax=Diplogelasinospora grovesii TaxID=303347 RepID=A0AAN6N2Q6_9PEZI|nr:hypothetical protein QBC46DRAFT_390937 [Diplogelasinospora grovesii]
MKAGLFAVIAWALCLANQFVTANVDAAGWEAAYLWYAYLMDKDIGAGKIAPGLSTTDLDTFLNYIAQQSANPKKRQGPVWKGKTGLTGPWTGANAMTVDQIATAISNQNYNVKTDRTKLLPSAPALPAGHNQNFGDIFLQVNDYVQDFRKDARTDADKVTRLTAAAQGDLDFRTSRAASGAMQVTQLSDIAKANGITLTVVTDAAKPGNIDTEKTIATIPTPMRTAKAEQIIKDFANGAVPQAGSGTTVPSKSRAGYTHNKVKVDLGKIVSDLNTPCVTK